MEDDNIQSINTSQYPTRDEFITQKLDSIRQSALDKARNTTETVNIKIKDPIQAEENRRYLLALLSTINYNLWDEIFTLYKDEILSGKNLNFSNYFQGLDLEEVNSIYSMYQNAVSDGDYVKAANCIANLSRFYPKGLPSGNQTFSANPGKYGFQKIDNKDIQPGDLVQFAETSRNITQHAAMFNGYNDKGIPTFNYSDGSESGWKTNKKYIDRDLFLDPKMAYTYTYTGTSQDSANWTNQWQQLFQPIPLQSINNNQKKLGGKLNYLDIFKQ